MFNPQQQYQAQQTGNPASPIMGALLQQYMAQRAMQNQQQPSTPGQVMGMGNGNSQSWNSSMPQQPAFGQMPMSPNSTMGQIASPQITNGR